MIYVVKGDITKIECDAIVTSLGGEVHSAICKAAGEVIVKKSMVIEKGTCHFVKSINLPSKYVIYTESPHVADDSSSHLLSSCYKNAIDLAKKKVFTSIAFPLIGSGDCGFSVQKAIAIAINRIEIHLKLGLNNLDIYFVFTDEDKCQIALDIMEKRLPNGSFSKEIIVMANEIQVDEVDAEQLDKYWVSLCRVNRPDRNNDIWLHRIADVMDGELVEVIIDETEEQVYENRPLVFRQDGPKEQDVLGFWEWHEEQTDDQYRTRTESAFIAEYSPIEIVLLEEASSVEELIECLKKGIHIHAYLKGQVIFTYRNESIFIGLLCDITQFESKPGNDIFTKLKTNVYSLPMYEFDLGSVFEWKHRLIYKYTSMNEPKGVIQVGTQMETIRNILLSRMSQQVFKTQGISRADRRRFIDFIKSIPNQSVYEEIAAIYAVSIEEGRQYVEKALTEIESYIDEEDVDTETIVSIIANHSGIRSLFEEQAETAWVESHQHRVEEAQKEIDAMLDKAASIEEESKRQVLQLEKTKSSIQSDIEAAQEKLAEVKKEIEHHERISDETVEAIRRKIENARSDISGFIADLSVYMPQVRTEALSRKNQLWQYTGASEYLFEENEFEEVQNWKDVYNLLYQNLASGFKADKDLVEMLSAFLYAANTNNASLLIAGPYGYELSNAYSLSMFGKEPGELIIGDEYDSGMVESICGYEESLICVRNMFGKGWSDMLPQEFANIRKSIWWSHPYWEDIAMEPKGLFNYAIPVLSECFVTDIPEQSGGYIPGVRNPSSFKEMPHQKAQPLQLSAFDELGISKILKRKLEAIFTDAKHILDYNKGKDVELLFGLLPLAVLTGNTAILKKVIDDEKGISSMVEAEVMRYIEKE